MSRKVLLKKTNSKIRRRLKASSTSSSSIGFYVLVNCVGIAIGAFWVFKLYSMQKQTILILQNKISGNPTLENIRQNLPSIHAMIHSGLISPRTTNPYFDTPPLSVSGNIQSTPSTRSFDIYSYHG